MDINVLRGLLSAVCLVLFIAILFWAYRPRNKARFEQEGRLPFDD